MDRTVSQADELAPAFIRSGTASTRQKFDNVEKLQNLIKESSEQNGGKSTEPEQILNMLKNRIKNNYNSLYGNYDANKAVIMKTIQQTQNNEAGENANKTKFQNVVKEKNVYDRLKAEVDNKQRKLKKLMDIRDQAHLKSGQNQEQKDILNDRLLIIKYLEEHRQILDYQTAILKNMLNDRKEVKLNLKERNQNILRQDLHKKQRIKKMQESTHTRKLMLQRLEQKIQIQEQQCQLPTNLAEELQKKLQEYQGKYCQKSIIAHQMQISQTKRNQEQQLLERQKDLIKQIKQQKQKQEQKQYQTVYNFLLLKQRQEEKIMKLCGVNSLTQITGDSLQIDRNNLQAIQTSIEKDIQKIENQNMKIKEDMEAITVTMETQDKTNLLLRMQAELEDEQIQLRRLKIHNQRKQQNLNNWEAAIQMIIGGPCDRYTMVYKLNEKINKINDTLDKKKQSQIGYSLTGGKSIRRKKKVEQSSSSNFSQLQP